MRGQRHRLKNIHRKKPSATTTSPSASAAHLHAHALWRGAAHHQKNSRQAESEVEQLKRERNMMLMEVNRLGGQNYYAHQQMKCISDRLQAMESRQQQIVAFVARAMCAPTFLYQNVNQAITIDPSARTQQKLLEDCAEEDSYSSGTRKKRCVACTSDHSEAGSGMVVDYNGQQYMEEHASSCEITQERTATSMTTTSDEETTASYDHKLLAQLNLENDSNSTICLENHIQEGGSNAVTGNQQLAYNHKQSSSTQSKADDNHHHEELNIGSTTFLEDVKVRMQKVMLKQPMSEGYAFTSETAHEHLQMMDLNLHPLNVLDDLTYVPSTRMGHGGSSMKYMVSASNSQYEDLESELFWEHLLGPVSAHSTEGNGGGRSAGFVGCFGLNE